MLFRMKVRFNWIEIQNSKKFKLKLCQTIHPSSNNKNEDKAVGMERTWKRKKREKKNYWNCGVIRIRVRHNQSKLITHNACCLLSNSSEFVRCITCNHTIRNSSSFWNCCYFCGYLISSLFSFGFFSVRFTPLWFILFVFTAMTQTLERLGDGYSENDYDVIVEFCCVRSHTLSIIVMLKSLFFFVEKLQTEKC